MLSRSGRRLVLLGELLAIEERRRRRRRAGGAAAAVAATDPANTTYVSDAFNRSDRHLSGDLPDVGAAWQDLTDNFRILSNRARANNAAARRHVMIDSVGVYLQAADGIWRVTVPVTGSSGLGIRWTDASNYIYLRASNSLGMDLIRVTAGVATIIGTSSDVPISGSEVRIDATGSAIDVYLDSVLEYSVVETQGQALTRHGLITDDITSRLDGYSHKNF